MKYGPSVNSEWAMDASNTNDFQLKPRPSDQVNVLARLSPQDRFEPSGHLVR